MGKGSNRIQVSPDSELGRLLEEVDESPLYLETGRAIYRVVRQPVLGVENESDDFVYDPEVALAGIDAAAGSWRDLDTETLKEYIYRAREEGARSEEDAP